MEDIESQNTLEFICEQCKRTFSKKSKLSRHVRESHLNIKNFNCTLCDKTFKRNSHLKRHMISHSQEPKPFKCTQCPMQFACKHHLERHIKTLHAEDFPFQCDICFLRFPKRASLFKHLTFIHNLKKPHKCCECDKDFFKNGQLIRHLKRVHPNSYHAQQQLQNAQEYQIQQRIQASLVLKNDKNSKEKSILCFKSNTQDTNLQVNTYPISENHFFSEDSQIQQQNLSTATYYYYSLENQIQSLNNQNVQQQDQQNISSATSVISFSSSSYPSSSPIDTNDQTYLCYKNMIDRYYTSDEIHGDDFEEDDDDVNDNYEESNYNYNMISKQQGLQKTGKNAEEDDDFDYLVSAAAMSRIPFKKEKKIKKFPKISSSSTSFQSKIQKESLALTSESIKYNNNKNDDLYSLDHNNAVNYEDLPCQMRKLSEEQSLQLNSAAVGFVGANNSNLCMNVSNISNNNLYFLTADEDILVQNVPQQYCTTLDNYNNFSLQAQQCSNSAVTSTVHHYDNNEEGKGQCIEALILKNNVATQQQLQIQQYNYNNNNNHSNMQSYIYQNNNCSQQKHEQEQQQFQSGVPASTLLQSSSNQQTGVGLQASAIETAQNSTTSCIYTSSQQQTQSLNVCYVPVSMQPTQKYQQKQQQQQIQTPHQATITNIIAQQQQQKQQPLQIQTQSYSYEPFTVKNEDTNLPYQQPYQMPQHSTFTSRNGFVCPLDYSSNVLASQTANKQEDEFSFLHPLESSLHILNSHSNQNGQNEVNFDFFNLMDHIQQQNTHQQLMSSDFFSENNYMDKLLMDYSQKALSQPQIPQVILPLSSNGLQNSQHIGTNYAQIAKNL